ncbi:hypothetical protein BK126_14975 [Paenibacillus sp. FSL H7-0326]|nr:hypothetical protein BK126_14975 [Paenibacillus sp. FSL H7-0326]
MPLPAYVFNEVTAIDKKGIKHLTILYKPQEHAYSEKELAEAQESLSRVIHYMITELLPKKETDSPS